MQFGSRVWHRTPGKAQGGLMQPRWYEGVWIGKTFSSDEHIVSMPDGRIVRARSVRSFPEGEKWSKEALDQITGKPWAPTSTLRDEKTTSIRTALGRSTSVGS